MEKSKVYFANFRATPRENIQKKLVRLLKTAGIESIDFERKYVAIKIHFGEPGNLAEIELITATTTTIDGLDYRTIASYLVPYVKEMGRQSWNWFAVWVVNHS